MKTILAPVDFSLATDRVVATAQALARAWEGRLILLHVVHTPDYLQGFQLAGGYVDAEGPEGYAWKRIEGLAHSLRGVEVEARVTLGEPAEEIVRQAAQCCADYVVIGSQGHSDWHAFLVGSTARRVLKDTACPVLLVPPGPAGTPAALPRKTIAAMG